MIHWATITATLVHRDTAILVHRTLHVHYFTGFPDNGHCSAVIVSIWGMVNAALGPPGHCNTSSPDTVHYFTGFQDNGHCSAVMVSIWGMVNAALVTAPLDT